MKDKYGIIGFPLSHSYSPDFFNKKFHKENIQAEYLKFEIPDISLFPEIIKNNPDLKGLNVTIPYKEKVIPFLDILDREAENVGAINVIKIYRNKGGSCLKGYNTDSIAFQESIKPLLKTYHKKALILGTGGASKAVIQALGNLGIIFKSVSRHSGKENVFQYKDLDKNILEEFTIIINTTPAGTFPDIHESPDIPYKYITNRHLLYDLTYNPSKTIFLKYGEKQGALVKNGQEMLKLQALAAWKIWNNNLL